MEKISLNGTETTPTIIFDPENGPFRIEGRSLMDNPEEFYEPIKKWLREYANNKKAAIELSIKLDYLNTPTSRQFLDLFKIMEGSEGSKVIWNFPDEDEDMEEMGQELAELVKFKFEFNSY
jgi:hypothetical protein